MEKSTARRAGSAKLACMEGQKHDRRGWIFREFVEKEVSWVGVVIAVAAFFIAYGFVLRVGLGVRSFTFYYQVRVAAFSVFGGLAAALRPDIIRRLLAKYIYLVGPIAYLVSYVTVRLGYGKPGTTGFYQVCAETLPLLLIGIIIEAELFTRTNMRPFSTFVNLDLLATGEGSSLVVVLNGKPSNALFAATVSGIITAFAIIVANAINRAPESDGLSSAKASAIGNAVIKLPLAVNAIKLKFARESAGATDSPEGTATSSSSADAIEPP